MSGFGDSDKIFRPILRSRRSLITDLERSQTELTSSPNPTLTFSTPTLTSLPGNVLSKIYSKLDLCTLGKLGLVSKSVADTIIKFLDEDSVSLMLFYSCVPQRLDDVSGQYMVRGSQKIFSIDPRHLASNFRDKVYQIKSFILINVWAWRNYCIICK